MGIYDAHVLADLHRADLLEEAANERLAKLAREGRRSQGGHHALVSRLVGILNLAMTVLAVGAGFDSGQLLQAVGRGEPRGGGYRLPASRLVAVGMVVVVAILVLFVVVGFGLD